jgi:TPR repeat protein
MWVYHNNNHDTDTGYQWLEKAAEKENCNALYAMAIWHENEGNDPQKRRYFRLAAKQGHADAQYQLGLLLEDCDDKKAPKNEEAFMWMKRAADQDHSGACYWLGNFYRDGTWVNIDEQKAFEYYSKAADLGNADGLERLGGFYANGIVVTEDSGAAFRYFQRAAELGNPKGQCQLGLCYLAGRGCRQDTEVAFHWITAAASTGHPAVVLLLKQVGLDIGKLIGGYKQAWDRFGENFEQIFCQSELE